MSRPTLSYKYQGSLVQDVFITEQSVEEEYVQLGLIKVDSKRMNSNLQELKQKLAAKAKQLGADAVINYTYGQKRTLLSIWDDTKWTASGLAIKLK